MSSFIPWVGGKTKLLPYIQTLLPTSYSRFIDVFGGSGAVTMGISNPKSCWRIYNDFNSDLTNLMYCVKETPLALIEELNFLPFNSRDDFYTLLDFLKQEEIRAENLKSELAIAKKYFFGDDYNKIEEILMAKAARGNVRRAAAYYKLIRYSFSGGGKSFAGRPCNIRSFFHQIWDASKKLEDVVIENKDFQSVIEQYDREGGFIYCDPPYYEAEDCYAVGFSEADHYRLYKTIMDCTAYVMMSYNYCPFIYELYQDFFIFKLDRPNSMSQKADSIYEEVIITNYDPRERQRQLSLFNLSNGEMGNMKLIHIPKMPFGKEPNGRIIFTEEKH